MGMGIIGKPSATWTAPGRCWSWLQIPMLKTTWRCHRSGLQSVLTIRTSSPPSWTGKPIEDFASGVCHFESLNDSQKTLNICFWWDSSAGTSSWSTFPMGWYVTVACRSCPLYKSSLGVYGTSSQGGRPGGVSQLTQLDPPRWPPFFSTFLWVGNLWNPPKRSPREKWRADGSDLKPFRLALVNDHCSHCWEGKWAVLH